MTVLAAVLSGQEVGGVLRFGGATLIRSTASNYVSDPLWGPLIQGVGMICQGQAQDLAGPMKRAAPKIRALVGLEQFATLRGLITQPAPQVTAAEIAPPPPVPAAPSVGAAVPQTRAPPMVLAQAPRATAPPGPPSGPVTSYDEDVATGAVFGPARSAEDTAFGWVDAPPGPPTPPLVKLYELAPETPFVPLERQELRSAAGAGVVALGQSQGLDPALIPVQPLSEILSYAAQALQVQLDRDGLIGGAVAPEKWQPAAKELQRLQRAAAAGEDTPLLRQQARSLLTSLGGVLPGTPQVLLPDAGDAFARSRTLAQELQDSATDLAKGAADAATKGATDLLTAAGVAAALLALGFGATLAVRSGR